PRSCVYSAPGDCRHLHSVPTRRSSDLRRACVPSCPRSKPHFPIPPDRTGERCSPFRAARCGHDTRVSRTSRRCAPSSTPGDGSRSEEHTSELQSREKLVCRLLLEKKNE